MVVKVTYGGRFPGDLVSKVRVERANYDLANQVMGDMDQFVPYKNGPLSQSVHIAANGKTIVYTTPYARAQFYGIITDRNGRQHPVVNYTSSEHPQATKRWDLKAKSLYMDSWERIVVDTLLGDDIHGS